MPVNKIISIGKKTFRLFKYTILLLRDILFTYFKIEFDPNPCRYSSFSDRFTVHLFTKHIFGIKKINCNKNDLIVLCLVRNGEKLIKSFINHYFKLGAKHIIFLDNDSTDKTVEIACQFKNITVLQNKLPYRTYAWVFKPYLISHFGKNTWSLTVDIDEFFDYPFSNIINIPLLLEYLNQNSYNAVMAQMLDMFSDKPLSRLQGHLYKNGNPKNKYQYYDISDICKEEFISKNIVSNKNIKFHLGGIRSTIFGLHKINLTKCPLIYLDHSFSPDDCRTHYIVKNAKIADFSCVLFHYKLTPDLYGYSKTAVKLKSYYDNSKEYKHYYHILKKDPKINIMKKAKNPKKFRNIEELLKNRFLYVSENYSNWIRRQIN